MSMKNRADLKAFFETGDKPTQEQFADLIDSLISNLDDGIGPWQKVTKSYSDWQPHNGNSKAIDAFWVPPGYQPNRAIIFNTGKFIGGTISSAIIYLRNFDNSANYVGPYLDVFRSPAPNQGIILPMDISNDDSLIDLNNGNFIQILLVTTDGTDGIDDLNSGILEIYYRLDKIL